MNSKNSFDAAEIEKIEDLLNLDDRDFPINDYHKYKYLEPEDSGDQKKSGGN